MRGIPAALIGMIVFAAGAFGQAGGVASISGIVHDPSGLPVANAKVVISSKSKGEIRSIQTNDTGVFSAPDVLAGC